MVTGQGGQRLPLGTTGTPSTIEIVQRSKTVKSTWTRLVSMKAEPQVCVLGCENVSGFSRGEILSFQQKKSCEPGRGWLNSLVSQDGTTTGPSCLQTMSERLMWIE